MRKGAAAPGTASGAAQGKRLPQHDEARERLGCSQDKAAAPCKFFILVCVPPTDICGLHMCPAPVLLTAEETCPGCIACPKVQENMHAGPTSAEERNISRVSLNRSVAQDVSEIAVELGFPSCSVDRFVADPETGVILPNPAIVPNFTQLTPPEGHDWIYPFATLPHYHSQNAGPWCARLLALPQHFTLPRVCSHRHTREADLVSAAQVCVPDVEEQHEHCAHHRTGGRSICV